MTENIEEAAWFKALGEAEKAEARINRLFQTHAARGSLGAFFEQCLDLPRIKGWRKEREENRGRER